MIYAQILNGVLMNTIEVDDVSILSFFLEGFDFCIEIDNITDINGNTIGIGWFYSPITNSFYPPLLGYVYPVTLPSNSIYQNLVSSAINFGNYVITQMNADAASAGIYQAGQTVTWLTYLQPLYLCLQNGFLFDAINEFTILIADQSTTKTSLSPYITNTNLTSYQTLVQNWVNQTSANQS